MALQFSLPFDPDPETDFAEFPACPAAFALFAEREPSVETQPYLSSTRNLRRRLTRLLQAPMERSRRLNLRGFTRRIEFQPVGSVFETRWLLYRLNQHYYPRQLRRRLRLRPAALVKIKLKNRFPRCYATSRLSADGSLYYGPFPSAVAAEHFTADFLDLYKIRRCTPDLDPDPSHPGCMYSQMKMCLAPCFKGCTDEEYEEELKRVVAFLDSEGSTLVRELEADREDASARLQFEQAAHAHRRLEKAKEVIRERPGLVREISSLHGILVLPGAMEKTVAFFRLTAGRLSGPATMSLGENVENPVPLDQQIQQCLAPLGDDSEGCATKLSPEPGLAGSRDSAALKRPLPPWEHLSLLARWYYSSFRVGEIVLLPVNQEIPHAKLIRVCRKVVMKPEQTRT
jgi:excinuclease ABC subunit C